MEIIPKEKSKTRIVFEINGEDHTFSNLLRVKLWDQKGVKTSGYNIKHPLVGSPKFVAETESTDVVAALDSAAKEAKKELKEFEKAFSSI
ncbi:MAG: RpoL/Rpb11 RNA polymerase subunit family protein [Candidatus Woesearchaeota archaeon]